MFDRSLLPEALLEFVVVADTHYMLDPGDRQVEFRSRRLQTARAEAALRLIASLDVEFVIHLGDLVQEFPEREAFRQAMDKAAAQLQRCGVAPRLVAGNHDVGDKSDPTMPTEPVAPRSLGDYHGRFGPSWYGFDAHGCHFIVLNSQIMNTPLPEAAEQREWLEHELAEHSGKRLFLFLHLPPYLWDEHEPSLGHYDNIAEPDRGWLLELVRRFDVELLMAGHVHWAFFDRVGKTRYQVAGSTSFTRPGFCHLFASGPPGDQGRDDAGKLGFYLVRVLKDRSDVHFIRTSGVTELSNREQHGVRRLISRTSPSLARSPLAITLSHPLSASVQIPLAWPSAIRQKVRNDYPLLSCLELGAQAVRVPATDLADPLQNRRLEILRDEGVNVIATSIWGNDGSVGELLEGHGAHIDGWELQLAGDAILSDAQIDFLKQNRLPATPIHLSAIVPGELSPGKQHPRTRHGFLLEELSDLNRQLANADIRVDRALCRIGHDRSPWEDVTAILTHPPHSQIGAIDCSLRLVTTDDLHAANIAGDALFAMSLLPGSRLFVDPLIDFDRTMDVRHGLLDTLCNPRPAFHALRCLNTALAPALEPLSVDSDWSTESSDTKQGYFRLIRTSAWRACLLLPLETNEDRPFEFSREESRLFTDVSQVRRYDLVAGTVTSVDRADMNETRRQPASGGPTLLVGWM